MIELQIITKTSHVKTFDVQIIKRYCVRIFVCTQFIYCFY